MIAIIILSAFIFIMFAIVFSYNATLETSMMSPLLSPIVKYQVYFMISVGALGIAVGATVFYLMSQRVESTQVLAKASGNVMLRFLSSDEQRVVKLLIVEKGEILQSKLVREHAMHKVRVHRIIARLTAKDIVTIENYGKTNRIRLKSEIYEALT